MKNIDELKTLLIASFPKEKIYLFGSRAKGTASIYSDYDIAIESDSPLKKKLTMIKSLIEESSIPYKIDLIELSKAPYLKNIVHNEGIVWH
jgi:predicted nucleotidyltransferase